MCPLLVVIGFEVMGVAVYLDTKQQLGAKEVKNELTNALLSAEFVTTGAAALERTPQNGFCWCGIVTQRLANVFLAGIVCFCRFVSHGENG